MGIQNIYKTTDGSYIIIEFSDSKIAKFSRTIIADSFKGDRNLISIKPNLDLITDDYKADQNYPEVNSVHFPDYQNGSYQINLADGINEIISAVEAKTLLSVVNGNI